jgi:hypothetical protein
MQSAWRIENDPADGVGYGTRGAKSGAQTATVQVVVA